MDAKKIKEVAQAVADVSDAVHNFQSIMNNGPADFYFEKLMGYYEGCMKAAKFQVGDSARLNQDIEVSGGWSHCGHFMKKDAKVKIKSVDYDPDEGYSYHVTFKDETYMAEYDPKTYVKHEKAIATPVKPKHHFRFNEKYLVGKNG